MSRIRQYISPTTVLAGIAVFLAMAGGAYAIGRNSVGTKQLKRNAVTTTKIKNRAVTGKKIRMKTLGPVPRVKGHATFALKRIIATDGPDQGTARDAAQPVPMFKVGPVTVYAKCYTDTSAATTYVESLVESSIDGVIFEGDEDSADGDPAFLGPATPEGNRILNYEYADKDSADLELMHSDEGVVMMPDGRSFEARISLAVKNGNLIGGNRMYGPGNVCLVAGDLTMYR